MISATRLRVLAREKSLRLDVVEKDYVNSWILHAIFNSNLQDVLVFKGGTALSKLYFPKTWRFSEDLDFTATQTPSESQLVNALEETSLASGISFTLKSRMINPGYLQLRIQYKAILAQKNSTTLDISLQEPMLFPIQKIPYGHEDIPTFTVRAYALEEIFVEKLRSLFQRARARDYYDLFFLLEQNKMTDREVLEALIAKCKAKGIALDLSAFPDQLGVDDIRAFWDKSLERLSPSRPTFDEVLKRIVSYIRHLESVERKI